MQSITKERLNPCNKVRTILSADVTARRYDRIEMRTIVIRHSEQIVEMVLSRGSLKFQQEFYMNVHLTFQPASPATVKL